MRGLWGAVIGGVIGWAIAGPWGAVLGVLLGYSLASARVHLGWVGVHPGRAQQTFFEATFSVMGCIAKADGRVSESEIRAAQAVMAQMNLNAEQQHAAIELFNRGKRPDFDLDTELLHFRNECGGYPALVRMFVQIQLYAALADGVLHPAEQAIFTRICAVLGISPIELRQYEEFLRAQQGFGGGAGGRPRAQPDRLAAAYQTLGVKPEASDQQVKQAYRRLMKDNHPDRLVSKGLPPEMVALAQEKAKQINLAYEAVKTARGMK